MGTLFIRFYSFWSLTTLVHFFHSPLVYVAGPFIPFVSFEQMKYSLSIIIIMLLFIFIFFKLRLNHPSVPPLFYIIV